MKHVKHLVVDSGAFIKNVPLHDYAENLCTISGVVKEIKDKATRQRLQVLPEKLKIKEPSPEALKYVSDFSKKTGDYFSLSATDLQIIALTYELEKQECGTDHLNKEPFCKVTGKPSFVDNQPSGFYYPRKEENETDEESSESETQNAHEVTKIENVSEEHKICKYSNEEILEDCISDGSVETGSESDEESWITPSNITEIQKKMGAMSLDKNQSLHVACITTDFSVQNVLIQMGLHVLSVDGMLIKKSRVFILRCYACYKTTNDTSKQFCPNCGNKTLKRVAVTVNEDGTKNIHINFHKRINIRGTRYSLPMPKGGKHAINPVLCEDQPIPHNRPAKLATQKIDVMSPDYEALSSPFAINDIYSRAANLGVRSNKNRYRRTNPNEWSKRTGNKKRK